MNKKINSSYEKVKTCGLGYDASYLIFANNFQFIS